MQETITYFATVEEGKNNQYNIQFIGIPECFIKVNSLTKAHKLAKAYLESYLLYILEEGEMLPDKEHKGNLVELKEGNFLMCVTLEVPNISLSNIYNLDKIKQNKSIVQPLSAIETIPENTETDTEIERRILQFANFRDWLKFKGYFDDIVESLNLSIKDYVDYHKLKEDRYLYDEEAKILATQITRTISYSLTKKLKQAELEYIKEVENLKTLNCSLTESNLPKDISRLVEDTLFYRLYLSLSGMENTCGEIKSKFSPYYITNYLLQTLYTEKRHLDLLELDRLGCDR